MTSGDDQVDTGVEHGAAIQGFARAALSSDPVQLTAARTALLQSAGVDCVVAVAGITGWFDGINRVADATGLVPPAELG